VADDDDTSAGLTPDTKPAARRRASRSAGPPEQVPASATPAPADAAVGDSGPAAGDQDEVVPDSPAVAAAAPDVSAAEEAVEDESSEATAGPARSSRGLVASIVAGVLVLALAGVTGWLLVERNAASDRDAQRAEFVTTAQDTVINLTTIKPDTAKEDVERILAGASGEFKAEFDGREDPFVSVVKEAGVTTVGKILESGIESEDGNTAKVLVAARADVSTPDGAQNGPRDFRMRVTVTDDGGTKTASKVEFVP
jgi:Mce-associated membrane protein